MPDEENLDGALKDDEELEGDPSEEDLEDEEEDFGDDGVFGSDE